MCPGKIFYYLLNFYYSCLIKFSSIHAAHFINFKYLNTASVTGTLYNIFIVASTMKTVFVKNVNKADNIMGHLQKLF